MLFLPPGNLPHPGIEPQSPAMAGGFFTTEPHGKLHVSAVLIHIFINDAIANTPAHRSQHESLIRKVKLIPIAKIMSKRI